MRVVPAVDIRGGLCVNLVQGDYGRETVFSEDPVGQAREWWRQLEAATTPREFEAAVLHLVDLDGAKTGRCLTLGPLRRMAVLGIRVEIGGGIRDLDTIEAIFEAGAERVILGTAAHRDPALLCNACRRHPGRIVVGIDAREGKVALNAWLEHTQTEAVSFARSVAEAGASRIVYTDILSDGMLQGPNLEATAAVAVAAGIPVTISGGVSSLDDVHNARALETLGVDEIIIGRALYVRHFTLLQAVVAARERP